MASSDSRTKILDTAIRVAVESGAKELTIDKVAVAAGMSKGGVFYHFKTKDELLEAMVHHIIDQFETACEGKQLEGLDPVTACIESAFSDDQNKRNQIMAMVAAVSYDKSIPQRANCRYEDWIQELQMAGLSRGTALLVTSTINGFYITTAFGLLATQEDGPILRQKLLDAVAEDEQYWYIQAFRNAVAKAESESEVEDLVAV